MTTREELADQILAAWKAVEEHDERPFHNSPNSLRAMAVIAAQAALGPKTWRPGEDIPDSAVVRDARGLRWHRDTLGDGTEVRVCQVPVEVFQARVGAVEEVLHWQPSKSLVCGVEHADPDRDWVCSLPPGHIGDHNAAPGMHWGTCQSRVRTAPPQKPTRAPGDETA
jgi:hypothetical protein